MRKLITIEFVLRAIISVLTLSVLALGVFGMIIALENGRTGIAVVLGVVTIGVSTGFVLGGRDVLRKHDPEAYEFRRYD